uniref:Uncharacterized protein n=1 Tax=viral metagenome TaxID=1070528 RepID=A0A6M3K6H6_9ZZZZ
MVRDLGRDVNIGTPPAETQQVNVVASAPITEALKAQVATGIAEVNLRLASSQFIGELILGEAGNLTDGE